MPPPPFALELLRNETEVSLIGLAPEDAGARRDRRNGSPRPGSTAALTDMLESVAHPAPEGWEAALDFGLAALADLPRAQISVAPGRVAITALADSDAERDALEARLRDTRPDGVALVLDITAPLPVIAPFRVDFALAAEGGQLLACDAETEADAAVIAAAAAPRPRAARSGSERRRRTGRRRRRRASPRCATSAAGDSRSATFDATLTPPDAAPPERVAAVARRSRRRCRTASRSP